jgi:hypothetical protein
MILFPARVSCQSLAFDLRRSLLVSCLNIGEVAQQLAHMHIGGSAGG